MEQKENQTASVDELLKKYDKETGNLRNLGGLLAKTVFVLAVSMSLFHLYTAGFGILLAMKQRAVHLTLALVLAFALYPARKNGPKNRIPAYDFLLIALSSIVGTYILFNYQTLVLRAGKLTQTDLILGGLAILLVLEATRRSIGPELPTVAALFLLYAYFGPYLPGLLAHRGFSPNLIINQMYLTTEGIFGTPIGVSATFVFLFILFGAFLEKTGVGKFFIDLAYSATGGTRGGPAKTAVLASGLMGSISGSSVANVVTTGSFTIPLMKSVGYRPHFAGAVEAAASTGGQIMPPVMGAAAFIMSEFTGIPYSKIIISAAIPAILYYLAVGIMVDIEAVKTGLRGVPRNELPDARRILRENIYMLIPVIAIIYFLLKGFTPLYSAFYGILLAIMVSLPLTYIPFFAVGFFLLQKLPLPTVILGSSVLAGTIILLKKLRPQAKNMTGADFLDALNSGARGAVGVACACACAGLIVGVVTLTGLGLKLAALIVSLAQGQLILTLFFTMIASIILGMGLPTTAKYIVLATMAVPALLKLNVPLMAAHLFILYFGVIADITPPVALAAYAGAGLAGANSMRTGWTAVKLALAGFLIPYIFCYSPDLLLLDTTVPQALLAFTSACLGIWALASSVQNFLITRTNLLERGLLFAAALSLIKPGLTTDLFGLAAFAGVYVWQRFRQRQAQVANSI